MNALETLLWLPPGVPLTFRADNLPVQGDISIVHAPGMGLSSDLGSG